MKTQRTHDNLYLQENRYDNTKEMFKFILANSFEENELNSKIDICDFGCANGEFLYFLNKVSNASLNGVDILPELLKKAKKFVPKASFVKGSVLQKNIFNRDKFDKSFLTGVHTIFDEFETQFNNLIYWTKPGGSIFITGMFNYYPVDVYIKYKESKKYKSKYYEAGWNMFSIESVGNFLNNIKKVKSYNFKKFEIGIDLVKHSDPIRSWTFNDVNNNKIITNGLSILQQHYTLTINL